MEHQPHDRPLAEPVDNQQAFDQASAEHAEIRRQLESANRSLETQLAQRTAQLQAVVAELSRAEQRERHRLAQLLHDDLQPLLERASQAAHGAEMARQPGGLQEVADLLDAAVANLRAFTAQVSPPILYRGTMSEILRWLAGRMWSEHDLAVQVDADPQADPHDEEVRILLFQVVRELLDNVVRHASARIARVTLGRGDAGTVTVTVTDNGIGFDPTVKLGQGRFGTGLSLSTFRRRLELLGGRMDIHSAPGEGTQVTLVVPTRLARADVAPAAVPAAAAPAPPEETAIQEPPGHAGTGRIRVLLADDHAVVRDGLATLLSAQPDMEVVATAANGLEAVDLAMAHKPDVIVMDANMPLLSGVQAARRVLSQQPQAKIIALSMYSAADMDLAMRRAGACEYLTKETAPEQLVATIRKYAAAS